MIVRHPKPVILARNGHQLSDRIADSGDKAIRRAALLAARGWPTSTNGSDCTLVDDHCGSPTTNLEAG